MTMPLDVYWRVEVLGTPDSHFVGGNGERWLPVGRNYRSIEEARDIADRYASIFGQPARVIRVETFVD
jgi:hypothetical protein